MKKQYEKPMIAVEQYVLSQTIANCSIPIGSMDSLCVIKDTDSTHQMKDLAMKGYFSSGECAISANGMNESDGICYHTNANTAFNS